MINVFSYNKSINMKENILNFSSKFDNYINIVNKKSIFTPGPASLSVENIQKLKPAFGRGDKEYLKTENKVLNKLLKLSGHQNIVRLQGSASLALEISIVNFIKGNVLLIETGFYSQRLGYMLKNSKLVEKISCIPFSKMDSCEGKFDWIIACFVETSIGLKIPARKLLNLKKKHKSKLLLDATASIGIEKNHDIADIIAYSSCKGLCGLTGGSFIAYNDLELNEVPFFYMNIKSHEDKSMTGPYHIIQSLEDILDNYDSKVYAIKKNKEKFLNLFSNYLVFPKELQPNLCSNISKKVECKNGIMYEPRLPSKGSIVCHLGEAHLGYMAEGKILENLKIINKIK